VLPGAGPVASGSRHHPAAQRRGAAHPGGNAGTTGVRQRGPLAAVCPQIPARPVPLPVRPVRIQLIGDKNYYGCDLEANLGRAGLRLLRPARRGEPEPPGRQFLKPLRQIIESVNDTFKGQLDLERHGGHTPAGVITRILQRIGVADTNRA
jgi:hypothetical protein